MLLELLLLFFTSELDCGLDGAGLLSLLLPAEELPTTAKASWEEGVVEVTLTHDDLKLPLDCIRLIRWLRLSPRGRLALLLAPPLEVPPPVPEEPKEDCTPWLVTVL